MVLVVVVVVALISFFVRRHQKRNQVPLSSNNVNKQNRTNGHTTAHLENGSNGDYVQQPLVSSGETTAIDEQYVRQLSGPAYDDDYFQQVTKILEDHRFNLSNGRHRGLVTIAVLDTGLYLPHETFKNFRVDEPFSNPTDLLKPVDLIADPDDPLLEDRNGHGTAVSAIIAGETYCKNHGIKRVMYRGLAPFAKLIIYKVTDGQGNGTINKIVEAFSDMDRLEQEENVSVDIVNISIGATFPDHANPADLQKVIAESSVKRIVVCSPSNDGMLDSNTILYPAAFGNTICVGSYGGHCERSKFSAVGQELDFLGPGENVIVPKVNPADLKDVKQCDGTSFATPYVTGITAQLLAVAQILKDKQTQANRENMGQGKALKKLLTNTHVMKKLLTVISTDSEHTTQRGRGRLQPWAKLLRFSEDHILMRMEECTKK